MINVVCCHCGFRFEAERKGKCPYCSSTNVGKEKSAEELIDEVKIE